MSEFKLKDWDVCENCGERLGEHCGMGCQAEKRPSIPLAVPAYGAPTQSKTALDTQVGGDHYKKLKIQPIEFIHANSIGFAEGNIIKYVTRWRDKNGIKDLEKARHFIDLLIQLETEAAHE